jgi:hypothetical protein
VPHFSTKYAELQIKISIFEQNMFIISEEKTNEIHIKIRTYNLILFTTLEWLFPLSHHLKKLDFVQNAMKN